MIKGVCPVCSSKHLAWDLLPTLDVYPPIFCTECLCKDCGARWIEQEKEGQITLHDIVRGTYTTG